MTVTSWSEGFRNPAPGSFGLARSGGRIAHINDASAVTHNPANLVDLGESEFLFTPTLVHIQTEYSPALGGKARTEDPWKVLPNLFFSTPLFSEKAALGLGITTPYGLSNEWENSGPFGPGPSGFLRYQQPFFSELKTIQINPALAVKIHDRIQVGLGLDTMWSELTLRQYFPWFLFPGGLGVDPEGAMEMEGDGWGFGVNFGVTWEPVDGHRIAATVRTPMKVKHRGDFQINRVPARASAAGFTTQSDFRADIEFPTIVQLGYGMQWTPQLQFETNVEWVEFSNFDSLDLSLGNNQALFPTGTRFPQNWKNTMTAGFALDWNFIDDWHLMGGYHYFESPVPHSTLSTVIPDASQNAITAGVGWKGNHHRLGIAYSSVFYEDRTVVGNPNPVLNGTYESHVHLISLNYSYAF